MFPRRLVNSLRLNLKPNAHTPAPASATKIKFEPEADVVKFAQMRFGADAANLTKFLSRDIDFALNLARIYSFISSQKLKLRARQIMIVANSTGISGIYRYPRISAILS